MLLPQFHVLNDARGAAQYLFEFIEESETDTTNDESTNIYSAHEIIFENVSFNYSTRPDVPILNGITFRISNGETVAIVGDSGSGTSLIPVDTKRICP